MGRRQGGVDETSFETVESDITSDGNNCISSSVGTEYSHRQLLADTLKMLSVDKSTKKKKNTAINKYIVLTILLSNILSIISASFTTYILTKELQDEPNLGPGFRAGHQRDVGLRMDQGLPSDAGAQDTQHKPSSHKHGPKTQYGVVHIDVSKERNTTEKQDEDLAD